MTEDQGMKIIEQCLVTMRDRFVISQTSFVIKIIKKDGVRVLRDIKKPLGEQWWILNRLITISDQLFIITEPYLIELHIGF